jgi:hypothetical protein
MSTDPKPTSDADENLGITFVETRGGVPTKDTKGRSPSAPTAEEFAKDAESSRDTGIFNVSEAFSAEHEMGTFVTDRKKHRRTLKESMRSALGEWWGGVQKKTLPAVESFHRVKEKDTPRVEKVGSRIDIVESAATHAAMAPKDDHRVVIEKIKTFKRDVEKATGAQFTVKEVKKEAPAWKHVIDKSKVPLPPPSPKPAKPVARPTTPPDLRDSMVAPVVEKRIKKDIHDFYITKTAKKEPVAPWKSSTPNQIAYMHIPGTVERQAAPKHTAQIAPLVQEKKKDEAEEASKPSMPKENIEYIARRVEAPVKPDSEMFAATEKIPAETPSRKEEALVPEVFHTRDTEKEGQKIARAPRMYPPPGAERNPLRLRIALAALSGVVIVGAFTVIIMRNDDGVPQTPEEIARETVRPVGFFEVQTQTPVPLGVDRQAFFDSLGSLIAGAENGLTQFYPTIPDGSRERVATSEEFFTVLNIGLPGRTARSLEPVFMVGSVTTGRNEPFIILRSYNFDALFAGFLAWEPRLRRDLSPLFDTSYVERDVFEDAVKQKVSARVLHDALGAEVLIYAFADKNTVVITSSEEALSKVMEEL